MKKEIIIEIEPVDMSKLEDAYYTEQAYLSLIGSEVMKNLNNQTAIETILKEYVRASMDLSYIKDFINNKYMSQYSEYNWKADFINEKLILTKNKY